MNRKGINRRQFVSTAALAAAGLAWAKPGSAQAQQRSQAGKPGIKVGLYSITFLGVWYQGKALTLEQMIQKAKEYGYNGIEIDGKRPHGNPNDWPTKRCKQLRSMADGEGIEIYAVAGNNDFSSPICEHREAQIVYMRELIRMASDFGARAVRVFFAWPGVTKHPQIASYTVARNIWDHTHSLTTSADDWSRCRDALAECARYAGDYGVTLALQNHAPIVTSYKDVLRMILHGRRVKELHGNLIFYPFKESPRHSKVEGLASEILKDGRETIYVQFKDRFFLKLYRLPEEGGNQEAELTRYLTEKGFSSIPSFLGAIEYRRSRVESLFLGMLQGFVPNEGDAWKYTFDEAGRYFERVLSRKDDAGELPKVPDFLLGIETQGISPLIRETLGAVHLELVQLLGRRTGELHLALASSEDPDFAPASFTAFQQKSLYQSMRVSATKTFQALSRRWKGLPDDAREDAEKILASEKDIMNRIKKIMQRKLTGQRIRTHGNYHLGQLMYTGKDFFIFGFEGEPAHALIDRKLKRSPIMDLASLIMSFHFAAYSALLKHASARKEDLPRLLPWEELWFRYVSGVLVSSYRKTVEGSGLLPAEREEFEELLLAFLLERAIIELGKSLDEPGSVIASLKGLIILLASLKSSTSLKDSSKKEHA